MQQVKASLHPGYIQDKPLRDLCTLGIGGPAKLFISVKTIDAMKAALLEAKEQQLPYFILGKGSNCLFDDRGFNGLVIQNKIDFVEKLPDHHYHVGAGYSFALLGVQTAREGLSGLEFASGIPASVGGAVYMNAGANGMETCECLVSVDYMDEDGNLETLPKSKLSFGYRTSAFQKMPGVIVGATFALKPLTEARQKQIEIVQYRQKTQPYGHKSAGCIFRNLPGSSAGKLIQECGLKGFTVGAASVSDLHANFLINQDEATSEDFKKLIEHVREKVREQTGLELESEVRVIPYVASHE